MTLAELIPSVRSLSHEDKILLLNLVTTELVKESGLVPPDGKMSVSGGYGLHDSYEAAAVLAKFLAEEQIENIC